MSAENLSSIILHLSNDHLFRLPRDLLFFTQKTSPQPSPKWRGSKKCLEHLQMEQSEHPEYRENASSKRTHSLAHRPFARFA